MPTNPNPSSNPSPVPWTPEPHEEHGWIYRKLVTPVLDMLRIGVSPERLAWSLAVGLAVGINPVLGSTTVVCLLIAFALRLNLIVSQISNHLVYPLQLLLLLPFLRLGSHLFDTPALPMDGKELLELARKHPIALSRELWRWEAHALAVWLVVALLLAPLAALVLTPLLRRLKSTLEDATLPAAT